MENKFTPCKRCCGTGKVGNFAHVKAGICFGCNGTGKRRKMKKVKSTKEIYFVRNELGRHDPMGHSLAEAERLVACKKNMGVHAWIEPKTITVTTLVPA